MFKDEIRACPGRKLISMKPFVFLSLISLLFTLNCMKSRRTMTPENTYGKPDGNVQFDYKTDIKGESPSLFSQNGIIHLSYASGDSIFYTHSGDKCKSFALPELVAVVEGLVNAGNRGPQIVCTHDGVLVAAPDQYGNINTWLRNSENSTWKQGPVINDPGGTAPEGFISLDAGDNGNVFAVWLDLREGGKNNVFGAESKDGGNTWMNNRLLYKSPEGSVCECCKPSVAVRNNHIAVMFRNNLEGSRDLYLMQSGDMGKTFDKATKLGEGTWKINACPMDGGGLVIYENGSIRTVWRRNDEIFIAQPGNREELAGKGMKCMIISNRDGSYILFIDKGMVCLRKPDGSTIELGAGSGYPKLKSIDDTTLVCAWENDKKISYFVLSNV